MQSQAMKLQHLPTSFKKDHSTDSSSSSPLTIRFKRARPTTKTSAASLDLKTFSCGTQLHTQDISPSGGTRWNPTQEQIRFLEGLYAAGMRTPNAEQIERITAELGKHGRIEGKNVFYWFQNHKARERQRQKRSASMLLLRAASPPDPIMSLFSTYKGEKEAKEHSDGVVCKRKYAELEEDSAGDHRTLELFPLHPEGGRS